MADRLRVLYVDDEPDLLSIGKLFLEQSGDFVVTTAISAPEALQVLEKGKFDAVHPRHLVVGDDGIVFPGIQKGKCSGCRSNDVNAETT